MTEISLYIWTEYFKCAFAVVEILRELTKRVRKAFVVLKEQKHGGCSELWSILLFFKLNANVCE